MRQYLIDQLRFGDRERLKAHLDETYGEAEIEGIYRVYIPEELLTQLQASHTECHPLYFSFELMDDALSCELLVRTNNSIRCSCIGYATETQRDWLIRHVDAMFAKLDIIT